MVNQLLVDKQVNARKPSCDAVGIVMQIDEKGCLNIRGTHLLPVYDVGPPMKPLVMHHKKWCATQRCSAVNKCTQVKMQTQNLDAHASGMIQPHKRSRTRLLVLSHGSDRVRWCCRIGSLTPQLGEQKI